MLASICLYFFCFVLITSATAKIQSGDNCVDQKLVKRPRKLCCYPGAQDPESIKCKIKKKKNKEKTS